MLLALGGTAAVGGAVFGSGAFSTIEAERDARVEVTGDGQALLLLEPVPGEERPGEEDDAEDNTYAESREGELFVDVDGYDERGSEGVNPNAITRIPQVFRIGNQGTQEVEVSITPYADESKDEDDIVEDVVFYNEADNDGAGDSNNVSGAKIAPGDPMIEVGMDIDTRGEDDVINLSLIEIVAEATGES